MRISPREKGMKLTLTKWKRQKPSHCFSDKGLKGIFVYPTCHSIIEGTLEFRSTAGSRLILIFKKFLFPIFVYRDYNFLDFSMKVEAEGVFYCFFETIYPISFV